MKNMKKQLFTAVAMLLVATVALGTATYAWFVNNTSTEVAQMDFQATTSMALEIGVRDTLTQTAANFDVAGFKSLLSTSDINTANANFIAATLNPVSGIPGTDADTQAADFFKTSKWGDLNGKRYATTFEAAKKAESGADLTAIPLVFRASEDMNVYLVTPGSIFMNPITHTKQAELTATEQRLADKVYGSAVDNDAKLGEVITKLNDQLKLINQAARIAFVADGKTYIVEPNSDTTVVGSRNTTLRLGSGAAPDTEITAGHAITKIDGSGYIPADGTAVQTLTSVATLAPGGNRAADTGYITSATGQEVLKLKANEPKAMTAYIWLEGCDPQCVSSIANYNFAVKLDFAGGTTETTK